MMKGKREFDLIIFGASGFTGQFVAIEVAKAAQTKQITWAIAGRSQVKLTDLCDVIKSQVENVGTISTLVADANDAESMNNMCQRGSILLNCTGPFRYYGESTVRACVKNATHYLDITGEPMFIESMMVKYNDRAIEKQTIVISACGFDSIPSDMGVVHNTQQFPSDVKPSSVEAILDLTGSRGHATTFECAVLGISDRQSLTDLRRSQPRVPIPIVGKKLKIAAFAHYDNRFGKYVHKFPGADASVVRNSQKYLVQSNSDVTPVQFCVYYGHRSIFSILMLSVFGIWFLFLTRFQWGVNLLLKYPEIFTCGYFTHAGPSKKERDESSFSFTFYGKGYKGNADGNPNWEVVTRVDGPEPGYVATPILIVECAMCVLDGQVNANGVLTTASAFRGTDLISRLCKRGIKFSTLKNGPILD